MSELDILKEIIEDTLGKAAKSMEMMLKIRVRGELIDFGYGGLSRIPELDPLGKFKVHLVKVPFRGDITGAFYFIISIHEADLINSVCAPSEVTDQPTRKADSNLMKAGIITEIDNLIASLSLTEISENLGVEVYPEVPQIQVMTGDAVNSFIATENRNNRTAFFMKSVFSGVFVDISPYFLWMMDEKFVTKLKLNVVS